MPEVLETSGSVPPAAAGDEAGTATGAAGTARADAPGTAAAEGAGTEAACCCWMQREPSSSSCPQSLGACARC